MSAAASSTSSSGGGSIASARKEPVWGWRSPRALLKRTESGFGWRANRATARRFTFPCPPPRSAKPWEAAKVERGQDPGGGRRSADPARHEGHAGGPQLRGDRSAHR